MHEWKLTRALVRDVARAAALNNASRVLSVRLRAGPLAGISPDHLREQFRIAALGSVAEGASLDIIVSDDLNADAATGLIIESLELAD